MTIEEARMVAAKMLQDLMVVFPELDANTQAPEWFDWDKAVNTLVVRILESHTVPFIPQYVGPSVPDYPHNLCPWPWNYNRWTSYGSGVALSSNTPGIRVTV